MNSIWWLNCLRKPAIANTPWCTPRTQRFIFLFVFLFQKLTRSLAYTKNLISIQKLFSSVFYLFIYIYKYLNESIKKTEILINFLCVWGRAWKWCVHKTKPNKTNRTCVYTESDSNDTINEHGIQQRRGLTCPVVTPIPDLRPGLDSPTSSTASNKPPFQGLFLSHTHNHNHTQTHSQL